MKRSKYKTTEKFNMKKYSTDFMIISKDLFRMDIKVYTQLED